MALGIGVGLTYYNAKVANIDREDALQELKDIAKMSYGIVGGEGDQGGKGYIGILNGRVIKFRTHKLERIRSAAQVEINSSKELRNRLLLISQSLVGGNQQVMDFLKAKLGFDSKGENPVNELLSRRDVAEVINTIQQARGQDAENPWAEITNESVDSYRSSEKMDFETVRQTIQNTGKKKICLANVVDKFLSFKRTIQDNDDQIAPYVAKLENSLDALNSRWNPMASSKEIAPCLSAIRLCIENIDANNQKVYKAFRRFLVEFTNFNYVLNPGKNEFERRKEGSDYIQNQRSINEIIELFRARRNQNNVGG